MGKQEWINNMIHFQARCRGCIVRRKVRCVRVEYQDIVMEVEGGLENLSWRGNLLPRPHFTDTDTDGAFFTFPPPKRPIRDGLEDETLQGETLQRETLQRETVQRETLQRETVQGETVQRETLQGETLQRETLQRETLQGETLKRETVQGETLQRETVPGETVQGETVQRETVQREMVQGETLQRETLQRETVPGETVQGETVQRETVQGETVQRETVQREMVQGETLQRETVQGETLCLHSKVLLPEKDEDVPVRGRRDTCAPAEGATQQDEWQRDRSSKSPALGTSALQHAPPLMLLKDVTHTGEALKQHRNTLSMELLWIQQAIGSRKKYLTLKQKMETL